MKWENHDNSGETLTDGKKPPIKVITFLIATMFDLTDYMGSLDQLDSLS